MVSRTFKPSGITNIKLCQKKGWKKQRAFLHNLHVLANVAENCRFNVVANIALALAAGLDLRIALVYEGKKAAHEHLHGHPPSGLHQYSCSWLARSM